MDFVKFLELFPRLGEPTVRLSDLGVSHRTFFHWKDKNVIDYEHDFDDEEIASGVKRKLILLNAYQALWVMVIEELRSLNIDLKSLVALKEFLFGAIKVDWEEGQLERFDDDVLKAMVPEDVIAETGMDAKTVLERVRGEEKRNDVNFSNISALLCGIFMFGQETSLMMYKEPSQGKLEFYVFNPLSEEVYYSSIGQDFRNALVSKLGEFSIVSVPIRPLLSKFFEREALVPSAMALGLYTENEAKLLDIIRRKAYDKITIYRDNARNDISFEVKDGREINGERARELRRCLGLKQYERAEVVYRNDTAVYINRTVKYKPK